MSGLIRSAEISDAPAIQGIYAPFVTDRVTSFETVAPDAAEIERRLTAGGGLFPWLVFEERGQIGGYAYASPHAARQAYRWSVNVSVYVDPSAHRRGIGLALYRSLFDVLRRQHFANAYGGITLPNDASVGLHSALGFIEVGVYRKVGFKFDRWWDVIWMHLRLQDNDAPIEPQPWRPVVADPDVQAVFAATANSVRSRA